jgi:hypothetical protein
MYTIYDKLNEKAKRQILCVLNDFILYDKLNEKAKRQILCVLNDFILYNKSFNVF